MALEHWKITFPNSFKCSSKQQNLWDQLSHTQFDMGLKIPPNFMAMLHDRKLAKWAVCQNLPSFAAFSYLGVTLVLLLPVLPSCQNIAPVFTCFFPLALTWIIPGLVSS